MKIPNGTADELLIDQDNDIVTITLNRPQYRNALTFSMYQGLAEICRNPPANCRVIVVRGADQSAFAAGTDIRQFRDFKTAEDALDYERNIDVVLDAIETCPVPTIAALSGACTGGGSMIATVCDLRIASDGLKFGFPIARTLGNALSSRSLVRLGSLLGTARTREVIFTSRLMEAREALQIGVISELLDNHELLLQRAGALARELADQAPLTLHATKILQHRLLWGNYEDEDMVLQCYQSEDFRNGLEAFLAKRKPDWQGK